MYRKLNKFQSEFRNICSEVLNSINYLLNINRMNSHEMNSQTQKDEMSQKGS